jgi:hypothetical protein
MQIQKRSIKTIGDWQGLSGRISTGIRVVCVEYHLSGVTSLGMAREGGIQIVSWYKATTKKPDFKAFPLFFSYPVSGNSLLMRINSPCQ